MKPKVWIQNPSSAHHPQKNEVQPLPMNGAAGSAFHFLCAKSRRGREVWLSIQKHDKPLLPAHWLTGSKGTSRFWGSYPSAHLLSLGFPDKLPKPRWYQRKGSCRIACTRRRASWTITNESLSLLCADRQTHGRERHSSLRCCKDAAPFKRLCLLGCRFTAQWSLSRATSSI